MPADTTDPRAFGDFIQPFQIEALGIRGRLVRLADGLEAAIGPHGYPGAVTGLLAETVTLATTLASALKFNGVFTLQTQSDGPVGVLLADVTSEGGFRAYAHFDAERVATAAAGSDGAPVSRFLGAGYLAFTVDQGPDTDRYQGITELAGGTLAEYVQGYFRQSEQLETAIIVATADPTAGPTAASDRRAAALMIQRLPAKAEAGLSLGDEDDWRRAVILMSSVSADELLDPALTPAGVLYRLYHEDGVRVFRPKPLFHACRCSREKVVVTLGSFPRTDIEAMVEDGHITVTCEFCGTDYRFDEAALAEVFDRAGSGLDRAGASP
ncbi:MAG: Hsp33 family molecular chaperone HslO [Rhodospirillales bacterium]